jgi:hypothetical protein
MATPHAIVNSVKAAANRSGPVGAFSPVIVAELTGASEEFPLAPDEFVDVGRLPPGVTTFATLIDYLRSIKSKLTNRDNSVENKDWDVAKSGELRLYKLFVCVIHALDSYINGTPDYNVNIIAFSNAVIMHGRATKPDGLAKKGAILWEKTFASDQPRTVAVTRTVIYLCMRQTRAPPPPPAPPVPSATAVVPPTQPNTVVTADGGENPPQDVPEASDVSPATATEAPSAEDQPERVDDGDNLEGLDEPFDDEE